MRRATLVLTFVISTTLSFGQAISKEYLELIKEAGYLYHAKEYTKSAVTYSAAFKANNWKGLSIDRFNAACAWALAGVADSAFFHLNKAANEANYTNYEHITIDPDLISLQKDNRWNPLLEKIKQNKEKLEAKWDRALIATLDSIYAGDQNYRSQINEIGKKFGSESKEMKDHWKKISENDSLNLIKVKSILEKYGWLGTDVIGDRGTTTLFLVIQHSDQVTQEKYLPIMREAVQRGNARRSSLALLEDRVALKQGKRQIYGSQIGGDGVTQSYYVLPLEDPDNVDKRRAEVGLGLLSDYLRTWQIRWDIEQYKKDLTELEKKTNRK